MLDPPPDRMADPQGDRSDRWGGVFTGGMVTLTVSTGPLGGSPFSEGDSRRIDRVDRWRGIFVRIVGRIGVELPPDRMADPQGDRSDWWAGYSPEEWSH